MSKRTCSIATCDSPYDSRGWCKSHYLRWKRHGDPLAGGPVRIRGFRACSIPECPRPARVRGWCNAHYENWRRNGDPIPREIKTVEDRFWPRVVIRSSGCWVWTGTRNNHGYGAVALPEGGRCMAHRVAYELVVGPIPEGLELDHLCRYHACVNPQHLQPVTHAVNMSRAVWAAPNSKKYKTHCPSGHPYSGANLLITSRGGRVCRICNRASKRRYELKIRARRSM